MLVWYILKMRFLGSELKTKISKYSCWPQEWYLGSFTFVFSLFVLLTVFPSKSTNKPNKASTHDALNYIALNVHLWEHAVNHFKIYSNFFFFREGTRCFTTTWNSTRVIFFFFFIPVFWPTAYPVVAHFFSARGFHPPPQTGFRGYGGENVRCREGVR